MRVASDGKLHPLPVGASRLKVTVVERPRAVDGERLIRMELTGHAHTACQVLVAGTASDPHAAIGAGIDAVHVWAIASGAASPVFVGAATLDRDDPAYVLDVVSVLESVLDDPRQVLYAQQNAAKATLVAQMKAEGVQYEERMTRLEGITWPKPPDELIEACFHESTGPPPGGAGYLSLKKI